MKEESELVLTELSHMKDALASAQERFCYLPYHCIFLSLYVRCSAVQQLIQQTRKNSLDVENPQTLLLEIEHLMSEQDTMRKIVETTHQQTVNLQSNLGNVDER